MSEVLPQLHRRDALRLGALAFLSLHWEPGKGLEASTLLPGQAKPIPHRLRSLRLKTHLVEPMRRFYRDTMGFKVVDDSPQHVVFQAGGTRLELEQVEDGTKPFYHFAFNIPENKIEVAREWLRSRVTVQRHAQTGSDIIHFEAWNAHSLFFDDPAGNLVEFIARHTIANAAPGGFGVSDILYASEIGIVPADQPATFGALRRAFDLPAYLNSGSFLGDEHGIIIVMPSDVKWIPLFTKHGIACPTTVTIAGHGARRFFAPDGPFEIVSTDDVKRP